MLLLHGEQYLELHQPIPKAAKLETVTRVVDIIDKGRAAVAIVEMITKDAMTGAVIFENEASIFLRGSGGFGKKE